MLGRQKTGFHPLVRKGRRSGTWIFVTMSVALFFATGAALDYARVVSMRDGIEQGVKSASEAAASVLRRGQVSDNEIRAVILSHFEKDGAIAHQVGTIEPPTVSINRMARSVTVDTRGTVLMTISRLGGVNEVIVPATFTTSWAPPRGGTPDNHTH